MQLNAAEYRAINHFFQYLDARPGRPLLAYVQDFAPVVDAMAEYVAITGEEIDFLPVERCSIEELYNRLTGAEKFVCAFNPTFGPGLTDYVRTMIERVTTLSVRAYTVTDMSAAFFTTLQSDPRAIQSLNARLIRVLQSASEMTITTQSGSRLVIDLSSEYNWVNMDCFTEADYDLPCNLPVGEVATYSPSVNGTVSFMGGLLGTIPIGRKYGAITEPVHLEIVDNRVTRIDTGNPALKRDLEYCLFFDEHTSSVNEIALGTNDAIPRRILGFNYKYEENRVGFHLGFGASLAQQNVTRLTPHHLDFIFDDAVVAVDGVTLFDGEYRLHRFSASDGDEPLRLSHRSCCGFHCCNVGADGFPIS